MAAKIPINASHRRTSYYIRNPQVSQANKPPRQVFTHFFAMEVTWK